MHIVGDASLITFTISLFTLFKLMGCKYCLFNFQILTNFLILRKLWNVILTHLKGIKIHPKIKIEVLFFQNIFQMILVLD